MFRNIFPIYAFCEVISGFILCDCNGKQTETLWEIVVDIMFGGKYRNHWDLKEFTNIYIT
jgi:hypothetical protein